MVVRTTLVGEGNVPLEEPGLLIVDAPNVDAVVGGMLGRAPRRHERFDPAVLAAWVAAYVGGPVEKALFTNVPHPVPAGVEGWVKHLVDGGWRVYARPKQRPGDDIDEAMVRHLTTSKSREVVVFSHDSACFSQPLTGLHAAGTSVTVLGFHECAGRLPNLDGVIFVDVDEVPGLYPQSPPRVRLRDLPAAGGWLERVVV